MSRMERMHLQLKQAPTVPLEVEMLLPEKLQGLAPAEVASIPLAYGRESVAAGDFFSVSGGSRQGHIHFSGDLRRVKSLGCGMSRGLLTVEGSVGMHAGAQMSGGRLEIHGDAGDWAGANMSGGTLIIQGNAGHLAGGAYRGDERGMRGGTLVVTGAVGNECGSRMRRGLLVVGSSGDFAGAEMRAGTLVVLGRSGMRPGLNMRRGTLIIREAESMLPSFFFSCTYRPPFLPLLWREIQTLGAIEVPLEFQRGEWHRFLGDVNEVGKGEILLWRLE